MGLEDIRKNRIEKLRKFKRFKIDPYPGKTKRTHSIQGVLDNFEKLSESKKLVTLAGRIRSIREHGGSTFIHFEDESGKIQAYFKKNRLGEKKYEFFLDNFDLGDFIEISGVLFKTNKGEDTIEVDDYHILAKSLLPLPEKWHGLQDTEKRYRKRYLDLIFNPEVKQKFELRSRIISHIRRLLQSQGFLEVETPILQPIYGGANARPFKTHLNALDLDLYLRVSPELYLKRLIVGGFGKVYEIGKCFRNEGIDRFHNPDFTTLEFYWAYSNYKELMKFVEGMFKNLLQETVGSLKIKYQDQEIDFSPPWERVEFNQVLREETGIDLEKIHVSALQEKAQEKGIDIRKGEGKPEIADKLYKKYCRPKFNNPTFLLHQPRGSFPLAKNFDQNLSKLASFQLVVGGWELSLGFSELNDPLEQRKRFKEQEKSFKSGLEEAQRMDEDFLTALEHGMPPAAGFGMGIDRLVALLTDSYSLREVILFPTMKPKD